MGTERTRSYLSRIQARSDSSDNIKDDNGNRKVTSPTSDRPRYKVGLGEDGSYGSLRKTGLSSSGSVGRSDSNSWSTSSLKRNQDSPGRATTATTASSPSLTSSSSFTSRSYVPIGKRLQSTYPTGSNSSLASSAGSNKEDKDELTRREAREAFLRGEGPKYDPSLRERENIATKSEREKDKERIAHAPSHHQTAHPERQKTSKEGPKEIIGDGYVGFANLPNQVYRKAVKRGFEFTLMVVGESGLGKSTLINSMFLSDLYSNEYPGPSHRVKKTVQVETTQVVLKEGGVQLKLTVVDTPGFGDAVDNSNCWQPLIDHIEAKYEEYLNAESRVNRKVQADLRVHCCLYFISPNGHGLKPLDIEFMKRLHDKVNIIPLISKADTMTPDECRDFKKTILNEIAQHKIRIYEFPDCDDEEENKIQKKLKDRVPFAVVGSNTVVESGGRKLRGRVYPWGTVEVENLEHNDFIALRNMLIRTHMQDLKDVTNNVHYENYRYNKLASVTQDGKAKGTGKSPLLQLDEERREHENKMKKMEAEMEQVFDMKVREKKNKLKESEADLQKKAEQMQKTSEQQEKEIQEKQLQFEKEKRIWEDQEKHLHEQMRTLEKERSKKKGIF